MQLQCHEIFAAAIQRSYSHDINACPAQNSGHKYTYILFILLLFIHVSMADIDLASSHEVREHAEEVIVEWARQIQGASPSQITNILKLLNQKYLLQRRVKPGIR